MKIGNCLHDDDRILVIDTANAYTYSFFAATWRARLIWRLAKFLMNFLR